MFETINSLIDNLSLDHRRGAAEIVDDIGDLLIDIARLGGQNPEFAEQLFQRAIRRLAHGQPSMAPVLNLLNRVCLTRGKFGEDWEGLTQAFKDIMADRTSQFDEMERRANELPRANDTLLVFSNSSTVFRMIQACRKLGWPKRIICSEARPVMEGLVMARKLSTVRIPITIFTDAALMSRVDEADAVWVGGDAISLRGLVNKAGSKALALLAQLNGIPFISLMSTNKMLSLEMLPYFHFMPQNPREIAADDAEDLNIVNEYYETIPLPLVTHVYTEQGLSPADELVKTIKHEPVSALFKELVKGQN